MLNQLRENMINFVSATVNDLWPQEPPVSVIRWNKAAVKPTDSSAKLAPYFEVLERYLVCQEGGIDLGVYLEDCDEWRCPWSDEVIKVDYWATLPEFRTPHTQTD